MIGTKTPLPDLLARANRFWQFYAARAETLLQRIDAATGRSITRETELLRAGVVVDGVRRGT
jgi:hypothetical protein